MYVILLRTTCEGRFRFCVDFTRVAANHSAISWINRPISTEIKSPAGKRPPPWSRSQSTYEFSRSASFAGNPSATLPQSFAAIHRPSFGPSARPNWSSQIDLASCFGRPVDSSRLNRSAPPASLGLARARTLCWNYFPRGVNPPRPPQCCDVVTPLVSILNSHF